MGWEEEHGFMESDWPTSEGMALSYENLDTYSLKRRSVTAPSDLIAEQSRLA